MTMNMNMHFFISRCPTSGRWPQIVLLPFLLLLAVPGQAQERSGMQRLILEPVLLTEEAPRQPLVEPPGMVDEEGTETVPVSADAYEEAIRDLESNGNLLNPALIEHYGSLGSAYQTLGQHEGAIAAFENAIHITKVNNGLTALEQIPYVEKMIDSYAALDDMENLESRQEYLYFLYQKNYEPNDPEMINAMARLADWNISAYFRENYRLDQPGLRIQNNTLNPTQRNIMGMGRDRSQPFGESSEFDPPTSDLPPLSGGPSDMMKAIFNGTVKEVNHMEIVDRRLLRVDSIYQAMQSALLEGETAPATTLLEIARRVAGLSFITKQEMDYERLNYVYNNMYNGSRVQEIRTSSQRMDESYRSGLQALEYRVNLLRSIDPADVPPEAMASALLDVADWHLTYGKIRPAQAAYLQVYLVLETAGFPLSGIDQALHSELPVKIPVLATHMYSRESMGIEEDAPIDYDGHVDVRFELSETGNVENIAFLGSTGENASRVQEVLNSHLRSVKFRPVIERGQLTSRDAMTLRYYYDY